MTRAAPDLEENNSRPSTDKASNEVKNDQNESTPLLGKESKCDASYWSFGLYEFIKSLNDHFGYKLLVLLFSVQHLMKGFALSFYGQATPYIYRSYHIPAPQVQIFSGIASLPWAMKPILGLISDMFPIMGYNKSPYMFFVSILGVAAFLYVGLMPHSATSITVVVICFVFFSLQCSVCDLLSEAKYAEKMQAAPTKGPALLTYVWFGLQIGGFVAVSTAGSVIHYLGPKANFLIAAVPAASIILPVALGFMEEKKTSPEEVAEARKRYYQQKEACALCVLMLIGSLAMMAVGLAKHDPHLNCILAVSIGVVMLIAFSLVLSPVIAKFNAFSLIQTALGVSTGGASFYFYTDTKEMYPEGPHFSEFFYNTVMGIAGSVCALLGIFFYQRYMSTWRYRSMLILTNLVLSGFAALDILMFARVNVKLGIPDHVLVLGLSIFESIIAQWQWMPQVVILSYLCPKGMEATMYALLAGCHNMGNTIASNAGALLLKELGVQPRGEPGESDQFKHLWVAATVSTILPLVAILVLYRLIPDARQNERIVDAAYDATSGSLWRRCFGRED
uniref:Folate/biopterin transporter n=1 Tax=Alexandrium andersonii TaxID=327968 RepID=A0A7S2B5K2_9DINO|mmetsp:Transcript_2227/g.4976  ORF Transcript_2227/g.4976 Transcript_2227/m.4976 type:complete len:562 (+) Transcript_2227:61-1746(+)